WAACPNDALTLASLGPAEGRNLPRSIDHGRGRSRRWRCGRRGHLCRVLHRGAGARPGRSRLPRALPWVSLVGGDHMIVARKCAIRRPKIAHFRAWIFPPRPGVAVGARHRGPVWWNGCVNADLAERPATAERSPAGATVVPPTSRDPERSEERRVGK